MIKENIYLGILGSLLYLLFLKKITGKTICDAQKILQT